MDKNSGLDISLGKSISKVMVIKEADTLMNDPELLAQMRRLYDRLGIPQRVFVGEASTSKTSAMQWLEAAERGIERVRLHLQESVSKSLKPLFDELRNPWEFQFLLPLGKKAYARRYSKVPEIQIIWDHQPRGGSKAPQGETPSGLPEGAASID